MAAVAFHFHAETHSRKKDHSAVAGAAYRSGCRLVDRQKVPNVIHDYRRRADAEVENAELVLPENAPDWAKDRQTLWNASEAANKRVNSTVSRDFRVAFPAGLDFEERCAMVRAFAIAIVNQHGCAIDVAMHYPDRRGDTRNYHAHLLLSTHRLGPDGFTEKTRELDDRIAGPKHIERWRDDWAMRCAEALRRKGNLIEAERWRYGHLKLGEQAAKAKERGDWDYVAALEGAEPTVHLGRAVHMERREFETERGDENRRIEAKNAAVIELAAVQAEIKLIEVEERLAAAQQEAKAEDVRKLAVDELVATQKARHRQQWREYSESGKAGRSKVFSDAALAIKEALARHREECRPIWAHHYQSARYEGRAFSRREATLGGVMRNALDAALHQKRSGQLHESGVLAATVRNLFSSKARLQAFLEAQELTRQELQARLKSISADEIAAIKEQRSRDLAAFRKGQHQRRADLERQQKAAWLKLREAVRQLPARTRPHTVGGDNRNLPDRIETRPGARYTEALPYRYIVIVESAADAEAYLQLHPELRKDPCLIVAVNGSQAALNGHLVDTLARRARDPQTGLYASFRVAYGAESDSAAAKLEEWFAAAPRRILWGIDRDRPVAGRWTDALETSSVARQLPKPRSGIDF